MLRLRGVLLLLLTSIVQISERPGHCTCCMFMLGPVYNMHVPPLLMCYLHHKRGRRHTASAAQRRDSDDITHRDLLLVLTDVLTRWLGAHMAQAELAANWPRSDVKADLAVNANEIPSQHGAAADKYYQLLSLHGDTVSDMLCKLETQPPGTKYREFNVSSGCTSPSDHRAAVLRELGGLATLSAHNSAVEPQS